jgi:septal ring factor EnvC (AmiA/AmiB activator)
MDLQTVNDGESDRIRLYIKHLQQTLAQTGGYLREAHAEIAELEETISRQGWGHAKEDDISELEAKNAKLEKALKEQKLKTTTAEAKLKKYEVENPYKDALAEKRREAFRMKKRMLQLNEMGRTQRVQEDSVVCAIM